ncbi:patatin-like phospholipase family protein [Methylocapsa polymorpha]|uniref:Patatin-like phospholipase family protein n=1 Tax=Methylocapsa polymorpha TaxID=3080828 RepID=A0ABZ0HU95_9HYPH|nr:patatin-like phospholipase family protein [Methylocapsa sp. RX1]
MADEAKRGDHDYVDAHDPKLCQAGYLPKPVCEAEHAAIRQRREYVKGNGRRDRTAYRSVTGVALSGGGIRSASFGLGALQALHAFSGIEGIDYLSTVSGGGYIGCSLTAATQDSPAEQNTPSVAKAAEPQRTRAKFPFVNPDNYDDTDSVRHIRDYSNYLIPHGALDVVTALGIIGRGLVANAIIVAPVLLFFVWITLVTHPTVASLSEPRILVWDFSSLGEKLGLQWVSGYWFTAVIAALNLFFLIVWALFTSVNLSSAATLRGGWVGVSKALFIVTLIIALFETQPFILWLLNVASGEFRAGPPELKLPGASYLTGGAFLASLGTVFAFFSKYLGDVVAAAKRATGWLAWVKKLAAMAALWLAAMVVPIFLWLCYLSLTNIGLGREWARSFYFGAFVISAVVAVIINPNRTSLFRLYRDRLSKAFLFDPDPELRDKKYGDLRAHAPKLHEIDTNLCPYPIVNASLNIEGSQYANKRGRNADFFVFTPEYVGSAATGYVGARQILQKEPTLDLGAAMAISGAAVSSNMGALTIKPLAFTLAYLNIRLGYWLRNPYIFHQSPGLLSRLFDAPSLLLFREMFGLITEKSPTVYLTDGGHLENLGVYSLMKRRCKVIIAIDAEADPTMSFGALLTLERYARIDLGATIELPWQAIRDRALSANAAFAKAAADGSAVPCETGPHCAAGEIQYGPREKGVLLYVKASLSGDEDDYILDYKRRNPAFPHETTGDQFFGEEQLEVYRALGFHIVKGLLKGDASFAVTPRRGESEDQARQRIRGEISAAL